MAATRRTNKPAFLPESPCEPPWPAHLAGIPSTAAVALYCVIGPVHLGQAALPAALRALGCIPAAAVPLPVNLRNVWWRGLLLTLLLLCCLLLCCLLLLSCPQGRLLLLLLLLEVLQCLQEHSILLFLLLDLHGCRRLPARRLRWRRRRVLRSCGCRRQRRLSKVFDVSACWCSRVSLPRCRSLQLQACRHLPGVLLLLVLLRLRLLRCLLPCLLRRRGRVPLFCQLAGREDVVALPLRRLQQTLLSRGGSSQRRFLWTQEQKVAAGEQRDGSWGDEMTRIGAEGESGRSR